MIDSTKIVFYTKYEDYFKSQICIYPKYKKSTGEWTYYNDNFEGLYISLIGNKVTITGSLHKFYHGNNYSSFTRSDIKNAVSKLCNQFKIQPDDPSIKIVWFEFGINIETEQLPMNYANCFISYVRNPFRDSKPKRRTTKIVQRECSTTNYFIKFYDKTMQTLLTYKGNNFDKILLKKILPENLIRYEITYYRADGIFNLKNLSSFYSETFLNGMAEDMLLKYKKIAKIIEIDTDSMTDSQVKKYYLGLVPDYWIWLKNKSPQSFKEERKIFAKIKRDFQIKGRGLSEELYHKITIKLDELLQIKKPAVPTCFFITGSDGINYPLFTNL